MPKFECRCRFVFNLSNSPVEGEYLLVPDAAVSDLLDSELQASQNLVELFDSKARQVLLCPQCSRLWLQRDVGNSAFLEYVPTTRDG